MNIYIDIEATQPENEIIAIGAVAENGNTFYSLVKPQLSSISKFVSDLTHLSEEDLEKEKTIDEVLVKFDLWVMEQESNIMKCRFLSYGNDSQFFKSTLPAIKTEHAFTVAAILMAKIEDCYESTRQFFRGGIRLIHAFNYIQETETKQKHDPLEDAMMLQKVFEYTQTHEPLPAHPLNKNFNDIMEQQTNKMPSGTFYCRKGKNGKEMSFNSCDDAITWLINEVMNVPDPESVHRDRVMKNIMKSIRTKQTYCEYKWRRERNKEDTNVE